MRILYLINAPGARLSGAGRQTLTLARHEAARGADVFVGAPPLSAVLQAATDMGLSAVDVPMTASPRAIRELRRTVRRLDPDIVHAMSFAPLALAGLVPRHRPQRPRTFVSILVDPASSHPMARRRFRGAAMRARNAVARRYARRVDAIFAVSRTVQEHLSALGIEGRIVIGPDTVDVTGLQKRARAPIALPVGRPRIGMAAAQLVPAKGAGDLVRAFSRVAERYPEAVCLIAGDADRALDVAGIARAHHVAKRVHMLGFLEDPAPFFSALDVYVMPSLSEGLNSSVLEAAALSVPTVATRVGGMPEAVIDGETGLLVPPSSPAALADAILSLLDDPQLAARLAEKGRARVEALFSASVLEVVDAEYDRALTESGSAAVATTPAEAPLDGSGS